MKCLEIARLQDFAPNTQGLLGALNPLPYRTNPPLKISAYGPAIINQDIEKIESPQAKMLCVKVGCNSEVKTLQMHIQL